MIPIPVISSCVNEQIIPKKSRLLSAVLTVKRSYSTSQCRRRGSVTSVARRWKWPLTSRKWVDRYFRGGFRRSAARAGAAGRADAHRDTMRQAPERS
ncbi:hypothetical protein EVAR_13667_1 [Eumeta japonica]|uniref:Uncharacterized protein n=1 Tax=Eumeta variegata TaxID=151549 RepID=A0A4C1UCN5_EUMVA|nr:hypothetical protein EVAR_13667_1 [Eumeta japonica]